MPQGDVILMFSGGVDSTTSTLDLLEKYERVHLVTYDNGHGLFFLGRSRIHVRDLQRLFGPERVIHRMASSRALFERITVSTLARDYRAYGGGFIWCVGCKLAMHAETIVYALTRGLTEVAEGVSPETDYFAEQTPQMVAALRRFYGEQGLGLLTPVYEMPGRKQQVARMKALGMSTGLAWGNRNPGTQPLCIPGNVLNLLDTFFKVHPRHDPVQLARYIEDKWRLCRTYIAERTAGDKTSDAAPGPRRGLPPRPLSGAGFPSTAGGGLWADG